jgi:DNA-binding LytR/AlgR family response regulator
MINYSLRDLEQKLDPEQFVRIHRNVIVNLAYMQEVERNDKGNGVMRLTSGETIPISRRLNPKLHARLKS